MMNRKTFLLGAIVLPISLMLGVSSSYAANVATTATPEPQYEELIPIDPSEIPEIVDVKYEIGDNEAPIKYVSPMTEDGEEPMVSTTREMRYDDEYPEVEYILPTNEEDYFLAHEERPKTRTRTVKEPNSSMPSDEPQVMSTATVRLAQPTSMQLSSVGNNTDDAKRAEAEATHKNDVAKAMAVVLLLVFGTGAVGFFINSSKK